ncbi:MAG: hypothetical protein WCC92_19135 [Candidatus Korobacteraceae bacterium]
MKSRNVFRTAFAVILALFFTSVVAYSQGTQARHWQLSPACKPKLRVAFDAVRDLDPFISAAGYESSLAEAKKELRQARAVATTPDDREAVEEIEIYRMQREACQPAIASPDRYHDCEDRAGATEWNISYGLGMAKNAPPKTPGAH